MEQRFLSLFALTCKISRLKTATMWENEAIYDGTDFCLIILTLHTGSVLHLAKQHLGRKRHCSLDKMMNTDFYLILTLRLEHF